MQLALSQLAAHLQKGLRSLYALHGDEPLMIQEAADAIRAAARAQGYTERSVHTVSGAHFDWSEVLAAGGSLSLFADKQIVEVRVPSGKPGKEGSTAIQQLAAAAQGNDSTLTLFLLPRLDASKTAACRCRSIRSSAMLCPSGSHNAFSIRASVSWRAKKVSARCSFLPTVWKATCWRRTRKSKN
jgi:DNA polymerase-3 subunit delta